MTKFGLRFVYYARLNNAAGIATWRSFNANKISSGYGNFVASIEPSIGNGFRRENFENISNVFLSCFELFVILYKIYAQVITQK